LQHHSCVDSWLRFFQCLFHVTNYFLPLIWCYWLYHLYLWRKTFFNYLPKQILL
jgi:hypothetical protein